MKGARYLLLTLCIQLSFFSPSLMAEASDDEGSVPQLRPVSESEMAGLHTRYGKLTGSKSNMINLVTALQTGATVVLKRRTRTENHSLVFDIPTLPMGSADIASALDITARSLADAGVVQPTIEQFKAALLGGSVVGTHGRLTNMQGVLQLRSEDMSWSEIAYYIGISSMHPMTQQESGVGAQNSKGQTRQRSRIVNLNGKGQSEVHTASGSSSKVIPDASLTAESRGIVTANGDRAGYAGITMGNGSGYDGGSYAASAAVSGMAGASSGAGGYAAK